MAVSAAHEYAQDDAPLVVRGVVEHGDERGRQLGFPTANVRGVDHVRLDGVYAGTVQLDPDLAHGPMYLAAVSVGHRPTYYGRDGLRLLEAHLLDFSADLYDREVRIELHVRLRPQHRYVDSATLVNQLHLDVEATRAWALSNGLQHLLADDLAGRRGRRRVHRAGAHDNLARMRARQAQNAELLSRAAQEAAPGELSYEWLARRTGIPEGYISWRFPDLAAIVERAAR